MEMLSPTRDALEIHTARAYYQAKIRLQTDQDHIHILSPTDISTWTMESDCMMAVWTRLFAIPYACLEFITCGCQAKCRMARCSCFKTNPNCTYACGCDWMTAAAQLANKLGTPSLLSDISASRGFCFSNTRARCGNVLAAICSEGADLPNKSRCTDTTVAWHPVLSGGRQVASLHRSVSSFGRGTASETDRLLISVGGQ